MFAVGRWAEAFVEVCEGRENTGSYQHCEAGIAVLKAAACGLSRLPDSASETAAAARFSRYLRSSLRKCGYTEKESGVETACAAVFLLIRRGAAAHIDDLIEAVEALLLKKRDILTVVLDCAGKPDDDFLEALKNALKKREKVHDVRITVMLVPEILAGYRINIDSEREDFSVLGQMTRMERALAGTQGV
jgi:hypothetical protein